MIPTNTISPKISVETIVERIFAFRQITAIDRQLLRSALISKESLSDKEQLHLNRVFEGLRSGTILVVE
jgi:hypothetical protein